MAELSNRQQMAAAIAGELNRLGAAWVVSPLPLQNDARLRFQVLDSHRQQILEKISQWGWSPTPCNAGLRFDARTYAALPCTTYELDLPRERAPVPDDRRVITGEIASGQKSEEVLAVLRHLGLP